MKLHKLNRLHDVKSIGTVLSNLAIRLVLLRLLPLCECDFPLRKDDLESIVLDMAMDLFTNKVDLDIIADEIMHVREESAKEHCELNILVAKQREVKKALDNVMKAVEAGVFTATTKNRMEELELEIDRLACSFFKFLNLFHQLFVLIRPKACVLLEIANCVVLLKAANVRLVDA